MQIFSADGRDGTGPIKGSTRGPRGPKKLLMHLTWRGSPSYFILRWKDKYSSTCLKYTCQICGNQVCKMCDHVSKRGGFAIPSPKEKIY